MKRHYPFIIKQTMNNSRRIRKKSGCNYYYYHIFIVSYMHAINSGVHLCSFTISLNMGLPFNTVAPLTFMTFPPPFPSPGGGIFSFAEDLWDNVDFVGESTDDSLGIWYTHPFCSTSLTNSSNGFVSRIVLLLPNMISLLFALVNATLTRRQSWRSSPT